MSFLQQKTLFELSFYMYLINLDIIMWVFFAATSNAI